MSKTITVKKGSIIEHKGTFNSHIYKVESGLLRSYIIDDKGKEHIFLFAPEGWIIADSQDFGLPSEVYIDALEDSVLTVIKKGGEMVTSTPNLLLKRVSVLQKRVLMLLSSSAIERYEDFVTTYPKIVQRVPQKMIASYLGITPEALSKVKGERSSQK
ncbi:MAG: Crp/Fnr family transcriptional regulator [Bacteroidetes bacterium]|nr:MAG: Crp/Fnr family transcriptional regulator [Bacteroidota bacterium]